MYGTVPTLSSMNRFANRVFLLSFVLCRRATPWHIPQTKSIACRWIDDLQLFAAPTPQHFFFFPSEADGKKAKPNMCLLGFPDLVQPKCTQYAGIKTKPDYSSLSLQRSASQFWTATKQNPNKKKVGSTIDKEGIMHSFPRPFRWFVSNMIADIHLPAYRSPATMQAQAVGLVMLYRNGPILKPKHDWCL